MGGQPSNYSFWLYHRYHRVGKANIDADTLLRVSWLGCMADNSGTHLPFTAAAVWAIQEAALKRPHKPHRGIQL